MLADHNVICPFLLSSDYVTCSQNTTKERMEMTTPVLTRKSDGERMEMTTPVITRKVSL